MKKYFFISDVHSFYTEMITALKKAKFDKDNPEHCLVVLGDVFDRGNETKKVYEFLTSLNQDRLILVRGNHEQLYLELLKKRLPDNYDYSNGTVKTFCHIAGFEPEVMSRSYWYKKAAIEGIDIQHYDNEPYASWLQIKSIVLSHPITKWLQSDKWANYFELKDYIGVHAYIPLQMKPNWMYNAPETAIGYREDWRNATQTEWNDATWGCPWRYAQCKYNKTGKIIICGHWHTSDFYNHLSKQHKDTYDCPIFKSKKYGIIGIDACTAGSGKVNVLIIEQE